MSADTESTKTERAKLKELRAIRALLEQILKELEIQTGMPR